MSRLTPMQRHQMRTQAAQASTTDALTGQQKALQWLHTQRGLLAALKSRQAREAHKAQVLPEIEPYLDGALAADTGTADPVIQYATVWALDAADWPLALKLGAYAIRHGIPMPDEFQRNAPTLIVDLMADAALAGRLTGADVEGYLADALTITEGQNMPDQTRAKAHKAIAYGLAGKTTLAGRAGDWKGLSDVTLAMALRHLTTAEQLDPNAGVKKDIAAVQKLLTAAKHNTHTTDTTTAEAASKTPGRAPGAGGAKTTPKPAAKKAAPRKTTAKKTT